LERVDVIEDFKAEYGKGRKLASVNRALGVLRHAINWGMGRTPAVFERSPFFRFGVKIRAHGETRRDRRIRADEEGRLLAAAERMNTPEHVFSGAAMQDRFVCAIDTACRRGEILRVQNRHVDWETCRIAIPAENAKSGKAKTYPVPARRQARRDS